VFISAIPTTTTFWPTRVAAFCWRSLIATVPEGVEEQPNESRSNKPTIVAAQNFFITASLISDSCQGNAQIFKPILLSLMAIEQHLGKNYLLEFAKKKAPRFLRTPRLGGEC
jgi:hypothetical protein